MIPTEEITSAGIRAWARDNDAPGVELITEADHPEHPNNNDWRIRLYKLAGDNDAGRAIDTNGDPVFEAAGPEEFAELLKIYGVTP